MQQPRPNRPWWSEPTMWLVIGAPAVSVVAGIAMAAIALRGADPVVRADTARPPALQARNHAATPRPQPPVSEVRP